MGKEKFYDEEQAAFNKIDTELGPESDFEAEGTAGSHEDYNDVQEKY